MAGWSKKQIVSEAYGEIGLADYEFDLQPEELDAALRKLDVMMGSWLSRGIVVGYAFGLTPDDTDLDMDSGVAQRDVEAVYLNLAVRIAAMKGKMPAQTTKSGAKDAFDALVLRTARDEVQQQQMPVGVPRGAGWKRASPPRPFLNPPITGPLAVDPSSGDLDFLGN